MNNIRGCIKSNKLNTVVLINDNAVSYKISFRFQRIEMTWRLENKEAVSKLTLAENHLCPNPKGCADFQRLPPFREGQRRR